MPILSGSAHAHSVSRLNVMRLGASRLGYYQPILKILLNGVNVTGDVRQAGFSLKLSLNGDADVLSLKVEGLEDETSLLGSYVELYVGDESDSCLLFGGFIQTADLSFESESSATPIIDIAAVSYHWVLNNILVLSTWTSNTVSTIINDLRDGWTPSIATLDIDADVASEVVDEFSSTDDTFREVLDRLAERVSAQWRIVATINGTRTLKFFRDNIGTTTEVTRPAVGLGVRGLTQRSDAVRIAAKVWSIGGGSTALIPIPAWPAVSSIPIADGTPFDTTPASLNILDSAIGDISCTPYVISGTNRFTYTSTNKFANAVVTTVVGNTTPYTNTIGVANTGIFANSGWAVVNDKYFRYFAKSNPTGLGSLFVQNSADYDSITVNTTTGDTVKPVDSLEGVIGQFDIGQGVSINVDWLIQCTPDANTYPVDISLSPEDFTMRITDGRLGSPETLDRGIGTLMRYFDPVITMTWGTRDMTMLPGREVTVNASVGTGIVANTYLIQSVTITREYLPPATTVYPMRRVEASSIRETFAMLMRRLRVDQGI